MGHKREDLTSNENLRFWPVFSYLVAYKHGSTPLAIVAVIHGKRDVANLLQSRTP